MLKVAHVFKSLAAGGIEKWLTDVAIENNTNKLFELHYLLQSEEKGFFEHDLLDSDVLIYKWALKPNFFKYSLILYKHFKKEKYDVVHSHIHHFSGVVLFIAFIAGVKVRVAHSHNDKRAEYKNVGLKKKLYFILCKILIQVFSNRKIAVSDNASCSLFPMSNKVNILPCGLRLIAPNVKEELTTRRENNKIIIGHIGSFSPQKNHIFICDLAHALEKESPGTYEFKLVGDGRLFNSINKKVRELGLEGVITFMGLRNDVRELIINEFDLIILPSLHEGLAMVALEAQYYGKTLIVSDTLSRQHTLSNYIEYKSIRNVNEFKAAIKLHKVPTDTQVLSCRQKLDLSPLSVKFNMEKLNLIYFS